MQGVHKAGGVSLHVTTAQANTGDAGNKEVALLHWQSISLMVTVSFRTAERDQLITLNGDCSPSWADTGAA